MNIEFLADRIEAIPVVAKWYFEEWGHLVPECSLETFLAAISKGTNRDQPPVVILAVEDEKVIGAAELKPHEMLGIFPGLTPWLGGVYVVPAHRNVGVASRLAHKVLELAEAFGFEQIFLQTTQLDGGLYAQLGWKPMETLSYRGQDVLVMKRHLIDKPG